MRTLTVHVTPSAAQDHVEHVTDDTYRVHTTAPPVQGRANRAVLEQLATHLHVPLTALTIVRGRTSRMKTITVQ